MDIIQFPRVQFISFQDVLIIQADVTHEGETKRIIDETIDRFGKIDILVIFIY